MSSSNWMVQVPVNDLLALMGLEEELKNCRAENAQLRREMDGLRRIQSETMQVLGDLRKKCVSL